MDNARHNEVEEYRHRGSALRDQVTPIVNGGWQKRMRHRDKKEKEIYTERDSVHAIKDTSTTANMTSYG